MNKKLIILIVALECVFSVFLISVFGPMIEAMHSKVLVSDIYLKDEDQVRLETPEGEEMPTIRIDVPNDYDYRFYVVVETDEATDKSYTVTHNSTDDEIEIQKKRDGFVVTFIGETTTVTVTVTANDGSGQSASVLVTRTGGNTDLGDDF